MPSLFAQQRNLVLEGIIDYWYLEATAQLLKDGRIETLNDKIALVFANSAGKVVYYATILYAHHLKVAALLDSDAVGDQATQQETLTHTLGNKNIMRTKDFCDRNINHPEIEDLLRDTLVALVKDEYRVDVALTVTKQPNRPIIDIFTQEVPNLSKYKLAKVYIRWTRSHEAKDLAEKERTQWRKMLQEINQVLK